MTEEDKKTICEMWCTQKINSLEISEYLGLTLTEVNDYLKGKIQPPNRDGGIPQSTGAKTHIAKDV